MHMSTDTSLSVCMCQTNTHIFPSKCTTELQRLSVQRHYFVAFVLYFKWLVCFDSHLLPFKWKWRQLNMQPSICSDICISNDFHFSILWKLFHTFNPRPIFCPLIQKRSAFDSWPPAIFPQNTLLSSFHRNHQKTAIKHNKEWADSGPLRGKLIYLYSLSAGLGVCFSSRSHSINAPSVLF